VAKKSIVLAVLALFAVSPAFADKGDFWLGLQGGTSRPTEDHDEETSLGFQGTLVATYMVGRTFGVGADVGYHIWPGKQEFAPPGADYGYNIIQATAHGVYSLPIGGTTTPYLEAGVGLYRIEVEASHATDPADNFRFSSSGIGFNLAAGVNWLVSPRYQIGLGAAYHVFDADVTGSSLATGTYSQLSDIFTVGVSLLWRAGH
jgi:opacity protein-like surface antigen